VFKIQAAIVQRHRIILSQASSILR